MKNLYDLNAEIEFGSDSAPTNNVHDSTAAQIEQLSADGYRILVGNNPMMDKAKKWQGHKLVRISLVNSRFHGKSIRTIWGVK